MVELFCPTCKRFNKCEVVKTNSRLVKCLFCETEYSLSDSNTAIFGMTPSEVIKGKSDMAYYRKALDKKVTTICCSVRIRYKQAILAYAQREAGSVANVTGKILEKWVEDNNLFKLITSPDIQEEFEFREED